METSLLDELSLAIISELEQDPLISNQALADKLGATKSKVVTRLKRIESLDAAHVIANTSATAGGYLLYQVFLTVSDRQVAEVADELGKLNEAMFIAGLVGEEDLYLVLRAHHSRSQVSLFRLLSTCDGVSGVRFDSILGCLAAKYNRISFDPNRKVLSLAERKAQLGIDLAELGLDDLDLTIIAEMHEQGRASSRLIARDSGVTEGTVRYRIKNLTERNLLTIITAVEPTIKGQTTWALMRVSADPSAIAGIVSAFENEEWMEIMQLTSGSDILTLTVLTTGQAQLSDTVAHVRNHPAVSEVSPALLAAIYKLDTRWHVPLIDGW